MIDPFRFLERHHDWVIRLGAPRSRHLGRAWCQHRNVYEAKQSFQTLIIPRELHYLPRILSSSIFFQYRLGLDSGCVCFRLWKGDSARQKDLEGGPRCLRQNRSDRIHAIGDGANVAYSLDAHSRASARSRGGHKQSVDRSAR